MSQFVQSSRHVVIHVPLLVAASWRPTASKSLDKNWLFATSVLTTKSALSSVTAALFSPSVVWLLPRAERHREAVAGQIEIVGAHRPGVRERDLELRRVMDGGPAVDGDDQERVVGTTDR